MANKTMLKICHLLNQCDGCDKKILYRGRLKKEVQEEVCGNCPVFEQLAELRPLIDGDQPYQYKRILAKGKNMTTSEVAFLVRENVRKADIRQAIGMNDASFRELLQHLGLSKRQAVSG